MTKERWIELRKNQDQLSFEAAFAYWNAVKPKEWRDLDYTEFVTKFVEYTNLGMPVMTQEQRMTMWRPEVANLKIREYYDNKFDIEPDAGFGNQFGGTVFTGEPVQQSGFQSSEAGEKKEDKFEAESFGEEGIPNEHKSTDTTSS
jgi:hypothetical protein